MPRVPMKAKKAAPLPPPRALRAAAAHELSLVAAFDDLVRNSMVLNEGCEKQFLQFVQNTRKWSSQWKHGEVERQRLVGLLREKDKELTAKEYKIKQARKIVEDERSGRLQAESERDELAKQLNMLKDILLKDNGRGGFDNETLERVRHIDTTNIGRRTRSPMKPMPCVEESVDDVDDLSFDETHDGMLFDDDPPPAPEPGPPPPAPRRRSSARLAEQHQQQKRRSSARFEQAQRRRKSRSLGTCLDNDNHNQVLKATTHVTLDKTGQAHAESYIEAVPMSGAAQLDIKNLRKAARKSRESRGERRVTYSDRLQEQEFSPSAPPMPMPAPAAPPSYHEDAARSALNQAQLIATPHRNHRSPGVRRHLSNASSIMNRRHVFQEVKEVKAERCDGCGARIRMLKKRFKCRGCGVVACDENCENKVPLPCAAGGNRTPTNKTMGLTLADWAPDTSPMIPPLLIHCISHIESRGLDELGLYRVPGSQVDVNELLGRLRRGKGPRDMHKFEVHAVTSTVKKFLRDLREPVVPHSLWKTFAEAATNPDCTDAEAAMYQAVSELPRPNRDTLAFLILHLQKVAESPVCQMPVDSLAMVMGPTVVGYSSNDPAATQADVPVQKQVMRTLLSISSDYWSDFLHVDLENLYPPTPGMQSGTPDLPAHMFATPRPTTAVAKRTRSRSKMLKKPILYYQSPLL